MSELVLRGRADTIPAGATCQGLDTDRMPCGDVNDTGSITALGG
jgi:hypothetical protein